MSDALSTFTTAELRAELARRERAETEANWRRMKAKARYTCWACGGPDGWHERGCVSDATDTAT